MSQEHTIESSVAFVICHSNKLFYSIQNNLYRLSYFYEFYKFIYPRDEKLERKGYSVIESEGSYYMTEPLK